MKKIVFAALSLMSLFFNTVQAKKTYREKDMAAYLMVFFTDATHSLFMALSTDGYRFIALNDNKPVLAGDSIAQQKGIRDPHIFRGPDGTFYLAMTDLHIFAQREGLRTTEWERDGKEYGWGNNRSLVLMKSKDLIHWSRTILNVDRDFPEEWGDVGCIWAPETAVDPKTGKIMLYFTMRHKNGINRIYYAFMNDEFTKMESAPKLLFSYPDETQSYIDGDIVYARGKYRLFYVSHDGTAGIKQAVSDSIHCGYVYDPTWYDLEKQACEAPNVWKRIGQEKWVLMYDIYGIQPHNFGFSETSDFKTFTDIGRFNEGAMKAVNFQSPKHGAVIHLTRKEAKRLAEYWNTEIEGLYSLPRRK